LRIARVGLSLVGIALAGCAAVHPASPAARPPATHSESPSAFDGLPSGRVRTRSLELPLELALPERKGWLIQDGPLWFVARHAATRSELAVRSWRAARLVSRSACDQQARLNRQEIPTLAEESIVERRAVAIPSGFDGELTVGVVARAAGLRGYVYLVSASVGQCVAALFSTEVDAPASEAEVAGRLQLAVSEIFEQVRTRAIDERGTRRRLLTPTR
jgi:hypothetical protein